MAQITDMRKMLKNGRHENFYLFNISKGKLRNIFPWRSHELPKRNYSSALKSRRKTYVWKLKPGKFKLQNKSLEIWELSMTIKLLRKKGGFSACCWSTKENNR